jgi:histidine triad (HIT) family protein
MDDCIFCKISRGEIPAEIIYENDNFFSIPDRNQQIEGHSLVISKRHFPTVLDLPSSLGTELLDCIKNTAIKMIDKEKADGFNVVSNNLESAGQVVGHVHFHILPRKKGGKVPRVY